MKKSRGLLLLLPLVFLLLLFSASALGEEARDITDRCGFSSSGGKGDIGKIADGSYDTRFSCDKRRHPWIEVTAPAGESICGVYLCFGDLSVRPWEIQVRREGTWVAAESRPGDYAHEYVPLEASDAFRVVNSEDRQTQLFLSEIRVFTSGEIPDWVQIWSPACHKADLLVLAAHPDDEILFFGGAIPLYAGEMEMNVVVAYMTCGIYQRRSELLDALWLAGVRNYPVIGTFWDKYSKKLETAYSAWGRTATDKYITSLYRTYRPEVVVTHDVNGEYGHGAHKACADAALRCVAYAENADKWPSLGEAWQVKKLYRHLGSGEDTLEMDWDVPLDHFNGRTAFETAVEMYRLHVSQQKAGQKNENGVFEVFEVEPRDSRCSCYRFTLAHTTVGPDAEKNDFFENVPLYVY